MENKVNFRLNKETGEIFAILLNTLQNDTYSCINLYSGEKVSIKKQTVKYFLNLRMKNGYNLSVFARSLENIGYENVSIKMRV